MPPRDWTRLYPHFDQEWPHDHPLRPHLIETLERVWADGLEGPRVADAVVRLEAQASALALVEGVTWTQTRTIASRLRRLSSKGAQNGSNTSAQLIQLGELHTLRAWFAEAVLENMATLNALPVDHPERRAFLYERQATLALRAKLEDTAVTALRRAAALRQG